MVASTLARVLTVNDFDVTSARCVPDALQLIASEKFDVLVSDLHMPGPGDGLTVIGAMRHMQPAVPTLLLSAFPAMDAAARAVLQQADEILVKPIGISALVEVIQDSLRAGPRHPRKLETVADILERLMGAITEVWVEQVEQDPALMAVRMPYEERCAHLPELFRDVARRLRSQKEPGAKDTKSKAAVEYGASRRRRGYDSVMLVDESRKLQDCIFTVLQKNLKHVDFSLVLGDVMTIADEVEFQLSQAMKGFNGQGAGRTAITVEAAFRGV
jgi:YesN/AraC family two-component response regulator